MCSTCLHTYEAPTLAVNVNKADPTRTTTLRNAFARDLAKRFRVLRGKIRHAIVKENILGATPIQANVENFAFTRRTEKAEEFMQWLEEQMNKELLTIRTMPQLGTAIDRRWTDMYVADSYERGVQRARYEMGKAGYSVPSIEQSGGISAVMSTPFHMDRVGVMYTRVFEELKGITAAMDTQISRVLAEGMINGDNPNLLASKINATISGNGLGDLGVTDTLGRFIPAERRATIMARTEVIRAHHLAMVQEYRNFDVVGVKVQAEWSTAGDARVCPECVGLENKVFPLKEIEGMIPKHPQCRCIALPKKIEKKKDEEEKSKADPVADQLLNEEHALLYTELKEQTDEYWLNFKNQYGLDMDKLQENHTRVYSNEQMQSIRDFLNKLSGGNNLEITLQEWQRNATLEGPMLLKKVALMLEEKTDNFSFPIWMEDDFKARILNADVTDRMIKEYLSIRAFNQSFLEQAGFPNKVKLYRGLGGADGESIRNHLHAEGMKRTKFNIQGNPLSGYTDNRMIADEFGYSDGGINLTLEETSKNEIFIHPSLLNAITNLGFTGEREYILIDFKRIFNKNNIDY